MPDLHFKDKYPFYLKMLVSEALCQFNSRRIDVEMVIPF